MLSVGRWVVGVDCSRAVAGSGNSSGWNFLLGMNFIMGCKTSIYTKSVESYVYCGDSKRVCFVENLWKCNECVNLRNAPCFSFMQKYILLNPFYFCEMAEINVEIPFIILSNLVVEFVKLHGLTLVFQWRLMCGRWLQP